MNKARMGKMISLTSHMAVAMGVLGYHDSKDGNLVAAVLQLFLSVYHTRFFPSCCVSRLASYVLNLHRIA